MPLAFAASGEPLAGGSDSDWRAGRQWVKTSTNKQRCPVFCLAWAPEGVTRCITGNSSGEFTLWKDGAFNFVTILQVRPPSSPRRRVLEQAFGRRGVGGGGVSAPLVRDGQVSPPSPL